MTRPADWSDQAQSDRLSDQVRAKVVCCKLLTTLLPDQWLLNHQVPILVPYGLQPIGGPISGGVLLLCREFYSPSGQGGLFSRSGPQQLLAVCKTSKTCSRNKIWLQWKSDIWNWSIFSGQRQIILQKRYHPRRRLSWILPKSCCFIS